VLTLGTGPFGVAVGVCMAFNLFANFYCLSGENAYWVNFRHDPMQQKK
jgi:hypothetical protein